jgi:hypothetical protein
MNSRELEKALAKLVDEVCRGLQHGFFEYVVLGEIVRGGQRRLTIKAGKSYQFTISEDEIANTKPQ